MIALQKRVVRHLEQLRELQGVIVIVSHAEPIRAALMHYLTIPLGLFYLVEIDAASISTITLDGRRTRVACVNGEVTA